MRNIQTPALNIVCDQLGTIQKPQNCWCCWKSRFCQVFSIIYFVHEVWVSLYESMTNLRWMATLLRQPTLSKTFFPSLIIRIYSKWNKYAPQGATLFLLEIRLACRRQQKGIEVVSSKIMTERFMKCINTLHEFLKFKHKNPVIMETQLTAASCSSLRSFLAASSVASLFFFSSRIWFLSSCSCFFSFSSCFSASSSNLVTVVACSFSCCLRRFSLLRS